MQQLTEFPPGAILFRQGESGDVGYLIEQGTVKIERIDPESGQKHELAMLGHGAVFGEMALLDPAPRMASAIAHDRLRCVIINAALFRSQSQKLSPLGLNLLRALIRTQRHHAHGADLSDRFIQHFDQPKLHVGATSRCQFDAGQIIYRPGDPADGLYIIVDGAIELRINENGHWRHYRGLSHDEVFGGAEALAMKPRLFEARAAQFTHSIYLPQAQLHEILAESPKFISGLIRIYAAHS